MASYQQVLDDAVAYWRLSEAAGTVAADDAGAHSATLQGGLVFGADSTIGPRGWMPNALQLDGVADCLTIPSQVTLGLGVDHTYSLWWKASSPAPWSPQVLIETGGTTHCSLVHLAGSEVYFVAARNSVVSYASAPAPTEGAWRHLAAVHRDASLEIFLDGVLVGAAIPSDAWVVSGANNGAIGAVDDGQWVGGSIANARTCYFAGAIAGVAIIDRALTGDEVAELYAGPEPVATGVPELSGSFRIGEAHSVSASAWDAQNNGELAVSTVLQLSPDGSTGWQDVPATLGLPHFSMPMAASGHWARVAAVATNDGGASDPAFGAAMEVLPARTPAHALTQATASAGALTGLACPSGGSQANMILPGGNAS
ncbi:hypothetical protein Pla108_25460 [Botrimarina colliarenosi]|uniref:LamG-like jellyroll fold domain-containing protein n=1 Tax=Botrimarina colliarenosi TaxID=2528001 RepID=A0A5C6A9S9_9BACT|nr:LamG domain-containing protein [Botrimarina colliarenosi]TWT96772.1 hypothetical protein Pla108_25460 [Botrimarina colliarenosi]